MNKDKIKNKVIVVTGASRGMGRYFCKHFSNQGAKIAAIARTKDDLAKLKKDIEINGGELEYYPLNITDYEEIQKAVDDIVSKWGRIDILINNAGINNKKPLEELNKEDIDNVIDINLKGYIYATRLIAPIMMRSKEYKYIFNISSMAGTRGLNSNGLYYASKFGINGFSNAMSKYLMSNNINVVTLCPGAVKTDWWLSRNKWPYEEKMLIDPGEVAGLIEFIIRGRETTLYKNIQFFPGSVVESW